MPTAIYKNFVSGGIVILIIILIIIFFSMVPIGLWITAFF